MRISDWSSDVCSSDLALARISATLEQSGGVARLGEEQKVAVFNDQELINNILTEAGENSRLVCKRVKRTGSHMSSNQCMTVAARDRAREHAQEQIRNTPPRSLPREGMEPNPMRILVIEANQDIAAHLGDYLEDTRHPVDLPSDGVTRLPLAVVPAILPARPGQ